MAGGQNVSPKGKDAAGEIAAENGAEMWEIKKIPHFFLVSFIRGFKPFAFQLCWRGNYTLACLGNA